MKIKVAKLLKKFAEPKLRSPRFLESSPEPKM
jgi:hypothetical protein